MIKFIFKCYTKKDNLIIFYLLGGIFMATAKQEKSLDDYLQKILGDGKEVALHLLQDYYLASKDQLKEPTFYIMNSYPSFGLTNLTLLIEKAYPNMVDVELDKKFSNRTKSYQKFILNKLKDSSALISPVAYLPVNSDSSINRIKTVINKIINNASNFKPMPYMLVLNVNPNIWQQTVKLSNKLFDKPIQGFANYPCKNEFDELDFDDLEMVQQLLELSK